ncbi:hypothetical protein GN958_ATG19861 [Phytophthora infestans]|uniref:Uncharacterized protein n=1 Tax=Phytophthora infestans TaxID=4787 RepID=A0A8S9TPN0_PHYIN|nr:hypothetical protein GN958_ATG19861 [Phytophthora infestans]
MKEGDSSPGDSSSHEDITGQFRASTGVKSKGRPKIRRKQAREAKKLRMAESIAEAKALVQGTLVPEKDLALVRKPLTCSFNVEDAVPVLPSITKVDAPTWKATSIVQLARKQKVHEKVTIVFPKTTLASASQISTCIGSFFQVTMKLAEWGYLSRNLAHSRRKI